MHTRKSIPEQRWSGNRIDSRSLQSCRGELQEIPSYRRSPQLGENSNVEAAQFPCRFHPYLAVSPLYDEIHYGIAHPKIFDHNFVEALGQMRIYEMKLRIFRANLDAESGAQQQEGRARRPGLRRTGYWVQ